MERKLVIELVPSSSWGDNLRLKLGAAWNDVRKRAYRDYGYRCGVCGVSSRLHCHERWEYDDRQHVQRLLGFIALCEWCHHCKHLGFAGILAGQGKLDMEQVISHYMRVNGCDRAAFEADKRAAFVQWRERSQHPWVVDLGDYSSLVDAK